MIIVCVIALYPFAIWWHSQTYSFCFELIIIPRLFLTIQHVHVQPAVTNARSTKLSPSNPPRVNIVIDEPVPLAGTPALLHEQDSKAMDAVGDLVTLTIGAIEDWDSLGAHDCNGDRTVVTIILMDVIGVQGSFLDCSGSLIVVVVINSVLICVQGFCVGSVTIWVVVVEMTILVVLQGRCLDTVFVTVIIVGVQEVFMGQVFAGIGVTESQPVVAFVFGSILGCSSSIVESCWPALVVPFSLRLNVLLQPPPSHSMLYALIHSKIFMVRIVTSGIIPLVMLRSVYVSQGINSVFGQTTLLHSNCSWVWWTELGLFPGGWVLTVALSWQLPTAKQMRIS